MFLVIFECIYKGLSVRRVQAKVESWLYTFCRLAASSGQSRKDTTPCASNPSKYAPKIATASTGTCNGVNLKPQPSQLSYAKRLCFRSLHIHVLVYLYIHSVRKVIIMQLRRLVASWRSGSQRHCSSANNHTLHVLTDSSTASMD